MKLRFAADRRTLLWALLLFPGVALVQYADPRLLGWFVPLSMYAGFCAGVFSHNHNHCPTFVERSANAFYAAWLSIFYGYPTFAWIPTHNLNHHKLLNREGDATITWRYSKRNTWLVASTYFFVSAYWQRGVIDAFVAMAKRSRPRLYRQIIIQSLTVGCTHAALFAFAVALHGWKTGALVYVGAFAVPPAMGLWGMIFINYIQHVHCDPWSTHNHSRNFVGRVGNWLVFNSGLHTAHHENSGSHWSELPAIHAKIAGEIHPELCQKSIFGFCIKAYLLGAIAEGFRTQQIGRAAYEPPNEPSLAGAGS